MMMTRIKERNRYSTELKKSDSREQREFHVFVQQRDSGERGRIVGGFLIRRMRDMNLSGTKIVVAGLRRRYRSLSGNNVVELAQVSS